MGVQKTSALMILCLSKATENAPARILAFDDIERFLKLKRPVSRKNDVLMKKHNKVVTDPVYRIVVRYGGGAKTLLN